MPESDAKNFYGFLVRNGMDPEVGAYDYVMRMVQQSGEHPSKWDLMALAARDQIAAALLAGNPERYETLVRATAAAQHLCLWVSFDAVEDWQQREKLLAQKAAMVGKSNGNGHTVVPLIEGFIVAANQATDEMENPSETVSTPWPTLNRYLLGGFRFGELVYFGGRPGTGKSAMASEIACHAASRGLPTAVISREMRNVALARRMIAQQGDLSASDLRRGVNAEPHVLAQTLDRMHRWPLWLSDKIASVAQIGDLLEAMPNLRVVVVDYLQLLKPPTGMDRRNQIDTISAGLKQLVTTHAIALIVLSSLRRTGSAERENPPTLADLKETSNLEHDADIILLLHRKFSQEETQCILAKNRDGEVGTVTLAFRKRSVRFDEVTTEVEYPPDWQNRGDE